MPDIGPLGSDEPINFLHWFWAGFGRASDAGPAGPGAPFSARQPRYRPRVGGTTRLSTARG
ncbi:hypothetical protein JDM601_1934 [Mycolicibacter sinensis]|uniref:Uncharacterized protein n=1 Tax=Mycolicibacter sinensis (strain JDM601) TaxID=875328 RepID=F5Z3N4_MYCSD|nr:hypothetical protein JDM601_1934 [Mycolicibacter sinensis]